ncbi:uncharacterized protein PITG_06140 [Phytophthora infestans T30-4]|uniref:F-box domain-containing protein n=1 Tax=Phytophthora infestans (strain T30-4) TaxID=403677 RepID=D0N6H2_PHYIT|nr:uncharacterized protein PITG_06140 [Phytophthora infestans T30-4]EEY70663.1 conserved hypothetical protein [Phytophthora infestans T30-4]|eukprot:XP_002998317.1 conserved hypothetical protein [Phytophthora infestans T30-4]
MLLELADECKQHIWEFMDVQELCRVACVARNAEQGVCLGPIWQKRARTLLSKGQEALDTDTGVLSCRLQRHNANTHLTLGRFSFSNTRFAQAMSSLQDLKRERSQLKEAMQSVKASSHADKRTRRLQMNCVKWMNRTHRRQAAASQSIQAQNAALSKAELASRLQQVENMIQTTAQEQFGLRKRAMKSLHKFNTQLATGSNLFYDLGALQFVA